MNNKKSTKRTLLTSVLSLVLCMAMLIGTTFAWFTDSVSSGKNNITAGNLDIELEYYNNGTWSSVKDSTELFTGNLWEPGHAEVLYLKLTNKGTLALKYQLGVNIISETGSVNIKGDNFKLSQYIEYGVVVGKQPSYAKRTEAVAAVKNDSVAIAGGYTKSGYMEKQNDTLYLAMVVYMPESVGNEANYATGAAVPTIDLGVNLVATQYTYEDDSFGIDYDELATYIPAWDGSVAASLEKSADGYYHVSTGAELAYINTILAGTQVETGINVMLDADINLGDLAWTPIGQTTAASGTGRRFEGNFDGNGHTIYNVNASTSSASGLFGVTANATIKNLKLENVDVVGDEWVGGVVGLPQSSKIVNCSIMNGNITGTSKVGSIAGDLVSSTITECNATNMVVMGEDKVGGLTGRTRQEGVAPSVTNNVITDSTVVVTTDADTVDYYVGTQMTEVDLTTNTYNSVSIVNNGLSNEGTTYYAYTDEAFDTAISEGAEEVVLSNGSYIVPDSAKGKTLTISGSDDTSIATQDDGSYEGCDYSLDGSTVTFNNVTITTDGSTYTGYARMSGTYNNCVINNTYTLYGDSVFNNCTFNVSGDSYNIWTWGAKSVEFNSCTFNTDGKSILVYNQSCDVYVNGCTFNDRTNGTGFTKSALETGVDGVGPKYNIYITDTTVNGFAENDKCVGYKNVVGNKNSLTNEYLNIVIDGVDVY